MDLDLDPKMGEAGPPKRYTEKIGKWSTITFGVAVISDKHIYAAGRNALIKLQQDIMSRELRAFSPDVFIQTLEQLFEPLYYMWTWYWYTSIIMSQLCMQTLYATYCP